MPFPPLGSRGTAAACSCMGLCRHVPVHSLCVYVQEWTRQAPWCNSLRCCHLSPRVATAGTPTALGEGWLLRVPADTRGAARSCPQGTPTGTH